MKKATIALACLIGAIGCSNVNDIGSEEYGFFLEASSASAEELNKKYDLFSWQKVIDPQGDKRESIQSEYHEVSGQVKGKKAPHILTG